MCSARALLVNQENNLSRFNAKKPITEDKMFHPVLNIDWSKIKIVCIARLAKDFYMHQRAKSQDLVLARRLQQSAIN